MQFKKTALSLALFGASLAFAAEPVSQSPGDDFFAYVNGDWVKATEIPADRSRWGAGAILTEETNKRIVALIEAAGKDKQASAEARKVHAFYSSFMDEAGIEAKGTAPLKPVLAAIGAIKDKQALAAALGGKIRADVDALNATNFNTENLFGIWVVQGLTEPNRYTPYIMQGGLGMPDRAYYLDDTAHMKDLRAKYQQHIGAMLSLAGYDKTDERAARIIELERQLASSHGTREDSADVQKANNPWSMSDFAAKAPGMDWSAFFKAAQLSGQKKFIVWHPTAVTGAAKLVASVDLDTWKDYMAFHTINHFAPNLPKAFVDQSFAFNNKALNGTPEQALRWKRGLDVVNEHMAEPVGHMYVDRYFPAENKARLQKMVSAIVQAFSARVEKLDWMAPATRAEAQRKLKALYVGIGYPDRWESFAGLNVQAGDALGNAMRAEAFRYKQQLAKLNKKVDPTEWCMPPQLVNAVNMPMQNALNFPAAILQAPYFDPKASDAMNYGAIGSVIGHEISHSFDDQGAQFDAQGRLRNWWTDADLAEFNKSGAALAAQYSSYKPFPDLAINGQLTLSENLADLAGLAAAYDAFKASKPSDEAADREFFTGFAMGWRNKQREAALRRQVATDGHAPAQYRVATVRNIDAWYKAFDVKPGQGLYLAPPARVRAW